MVKTFSHKGHSNLASAASLSDINDIFEQRKSRSYQVLHFPSKGSSSHCMSSSFSFLEPTEIIFYLPFEKNSGWAVNLAFRFAMHDLISCPSSFDIMTSRVISESTVFRITDLHRFVISLIIRPRDSI